MGLYSSIPRGSNNFKHQISCSDVNDDFLYQLFHLPHFIFIQKFYQFICFILFLAPIKIFLVIISIVIWFLISSCLKLFRSLFKTEIQFKTRSYEITKNIVRMFLFSLGVLRIDISGKQLLDARFLVSNHLSLLDYFIYYSQIPVTFIIKSDSPNSYEKFFTQGIVDIFYLQSKKRRFPSEQLDDCAQDPSYFPILLFPEDVPTTGQAIAPFKKSAFYSECPPQPIALKYNLWFTPNGFNSLFWDGKSIIGLIFRILAVPFMTVNITFLNPERIKSRTLKPTEKAKSAQLQIANELGIIAISKTKN